MNHNFLPFEVIELLPKENPYGYTKVWTKYNPNTSSPVLETNPIILIDCCHSIPQYEIRPSWTVIDCLCWLEKQDYVLEVFRDSHNEPQWLFIIYGREQIEYGFNSRIVAYTEGIKHCLNLIKDESNKNNN